MAARIGQSLLKKNKTLSERNELLEEQVEHIREEVSSRCKGWGTTVKVKEADVTGSHSERAPQGHAQALSPELPVPEWPGHRMLPACRSFCSLLLPVEAGSPTVGTAHT